MRAIFHQAKFWVGVTWLLMACACHPSNRSEAREAGASSSSPAPGEIGVPECDDFLAKYERCIESKVPVERQKAYEDALARTRDTWKGLAANPGARPGLPQACRLVLATVQTTMKSYMCTW
jgi:hypothetical protein